MLGISVLLVLASTQELELGREFTPHPLFARGLSAKMEVRLGESPFRRCGQGMTSREPSLRFRLNESISGLRVRLEGGREGLIRFPDGTYSCGGVFFEREWPAGTYEVYLTLGYGSASFDVRIDRPERVKADMERARRGLPSIAAGGAAALNPQIASLTAQPVAAEAGDLGMRDCVRAQDRLMPLARLAIAERVSKLVLSASGPKTIGELRIVAGSGACQRGGGELDLDRGEYTIYALVHGEVGREAIVLEADDRSRPLRFAQAREEKIDAAALAKPVLIRGTVRAAEPVASREDSRCHGTPAQPDLYLAATEPLQEVKVRLAWSRKPQALRLFGPIEQAGERERSTCGLHNNELTYKVIDGRVAIWIGGVAGDPFTLILTSPKTAIDPALKVLDPPADATVAERAVASFYPYLDRDAYDDVFTGGPDALFVYARTTIETDSGGTAPPQKDEPFLVLHSNPVSTSMRSADGRNFSVPTNLLTTQRPNKINLAPARRKINIDDLSDALGFAAAEDRPDIDAHFKGREKYDKCWFEYMRKNDPTFRTDFEVYVVQIRRGEVKSAETVGDKVARRAEQTCGWKKIETGAAALKKKLDQRREARWAKRWAEIRARFGAQ